MTLQVAPRYDVDGFERLSGLAGPEVVPFLLAGGVAVATGVSAWLNSTGWSSGQYNDWMRTMDSTIKQWDQLGWKYGCWSNAALRKSWLDFWKRFSTHYSEHGVVPSYSFVSDAEEMPARAIMQQLIQWGVALNKCGAPIATKNYEQEQKKEADDTAGNFDWGSAIKWGAIGIGGLVVLNLVTGLRGAFSKS